MVPYATIRCAAHGLLHGTAALAWAQRHGMGCLRYDTAVCVQAGARVGALCTRLNFDSMHCSESLFGHCSRGFQK